MKKSVTCIGCPMGCLIEVDLDEQGKVTAVSGNTCKRGDDYARKEVTNPMRVVTSVVRVKNGDVAMASVKTSGDIPKNLIFACMDEIRDIVLDAPVHIGDIVLENVCGTKINVIAAKEVLKMK